MVCIYIILFAYSISSTPSYISSLHAIQRVFTSGSKMSVRAFFITSIVHSPTLKNNVSLL